MTRTTSSGVQAEIAKIATFSFHIAKIEFASQTSFVSEGPEVNFGNSNYLSESISVDSIRYNSAGFESAMIALLDYNNSAAELFLNNKVLDVDCTLYVVYKDSSGAFTTPVLLAKGVLEPKGLTESKVSMRLQPKSAASNFYPTVYFNKDNGVTHLADSGTVVEWGDEKFELVN